jgi:PPM family protein phosphatase
MSRSTQIPPEIQAAEAQHIGYGQGRKSQEDRCVSRFIQTQHGLDLHAAIVVDSIGNTATSRRVGQLIVDMTIQYLYSSEDDDIRSMLRNALWGAHQAVQKVLGNLENTNWMGASVTLSVIHAGNLYVAHVGNTRAYLIRDGKIQQLTMDHILANEMVGTGNWTVTEASDHPRRAELARCLGTPGGPVEIDIGVRLDDLDPIESELLFEGVPLQVGDIVLLCTDGLVKERRGVGGHFTETHEIIRIVQQNSPQNAANTLVSLALGRQVDDNVSVVIMEIPGKKKRSGSARMTNPILLLIGFGIIGVSLLIGLLLPGVIEVLQPTPIALPSPTAPAGFVYVSAYEGGAGQYYTPGRSPEHLITGDYAAIMTGTRVIVNEGVIKLGLPDITMIYLGANAVVYFNQLSNGKGGEPTTMILEQGYTLINKPDGRVNIVLPSNHFVQASDSLIGIESKPSYFMVDCFTGNCDLYNADGILEASLIGARHILVEGDQVEDLMPEKGNIRYSHWIDKFGEPGAVEFSVYQTPTFALQTLTATPMRIPSSTQTPTRVLIDIQATAQ